MSDALSIISHQAFIFVNILCNIYRLKIKNLKRKPKFVGQYSNIRSGSEVSEE